MYKLGLDVNTKDKADWDAAYNELLAQRPLVHSYVMDEIFNMMESGEAAVGSYYAGDYFTMKDNQSENVDLKFYYPDKTNFYIDAMCIPSCADNKELAEIFINYMLSEEPAVCQCLNTPTMPLQQRRLYKHGLHRRKGEEAMAVLYPELGNFSSEYNTYAYRNLDADMLDYLNTLWENVKIN